MPDITLGHVFLITAAIELVFALCLGTLLMRADPAAPADRLRGLRITLAAALVSALLFCLLAAFLPEARMRLA